MRKISSLIVLLAIPVGVVGVLRAQSGLSANGQALVQTGRPDWAYGSVFLRHSFHSGPDAPPSAQASAYTSRKPSRSASSSNR